ncbi:hypothetical protein [Clostridium sp.]|jgi:hypothetical protein|uniref:hypothetical protein n=1 Tax=Clostridium sp. TaxID=1506 RepID=UPI00258B53C1|nr:hypothetical protein [Clostridium sp.]MDF2503406.1 hypothetical protein [Clostridium sp.]
MSKKIALYVIFMYLIVVIISNDLKPYRLGGNEELVITRWDYALEEIEPNKTKISYGVFFTNKSIGNIFIRILKPNYKTEVLNNIEYDNVIMLNKEIIPKEVLEVKWDIIVDKQGLTVKEAKAILTSVGINVRVKGEKILNHELVVTFNHY